MTVPEAAKLLGIKPSTVYALCAARRLAHARYGLGKGTIRIEPADLDAYIRASRVEVARGDDDQAVGTKPAAPAVRSRAPVLEYQLEIERMREARRQAKRGRA